MEKKTFRSRVSVLLLLLTTATGGLPLVCIILSGNIFNPATYMLVGALSLWLALSFGMSFTIKNNQLSIKILGITRRSVEISEITSIERSYNLFFPAAIWKRLKISFNKDYKYPYCLISPAQEQEFLDTLREINPNIHIRND